MIPLHRHSKFNIRHRVLAFGLLLVVLVPACQMIPADVAAPKPTEADTVDASRLAHGRAIYVSFLKCAMCHRPKPVYDFDPETWQHDILPRMAKKARLKPDDYAAVLAYVTSAEAQRSPE